MLIDILLIGAGGHGKVVYDAIHCHQPDMQLVVVDDNPLLFGTDFYSLKVEGPITDWSLAPAYVHVSIGYNSHRYHISEIVVSHGKMFYTVIHPAASVSTFSQIGHGVFLAAGSRLGPHSCVEDGVIVNHGAVVDHDCRLGAFCHIASNATLGGGVCVGRNALIGSGAVVLPGIHIGDHAIIGAGAVVTHPVESGQRVKGIPARVIQ